MSEPYKQSGDKDKDAENVLKVFVYNKVNVGGRDDSDYIDTEIQSLIDSISRSKDSMCERRKDVGIGILYGGDLYAEFKVIQLLNEVFDSYVLGKYYATVAVASMAAERLCYDFLDLLNIRFGETVLTTEALTVVPLIVMKSVFSPYFLSVLISV